MSLADGQILWRKTLPAAPVVWGLFDPWRELLLNRIIANFSRLVMALIAASRFSAKLLLRWTSW